MSKKNDSLLPEPSPLEAVFGMTPGSTPPTTSVASSPSFSQTITDPTTGEIIDRPAVVTDVQLEKEERLEDLKISGQLDTIYDVAIEGFEQQSRMAQEVDPKFAARNMEVALQSLAIALNTVNTRVNAKTNRMKLQLAKNEGPRQVQNNLVMTLDRNTLLDQILNANAIVENKK
jgi:hypothetical protein